MSCFNKSSTIAIVVTYEPSLVVLEQLLDALIPQVLTVLIVDNGSVCDLAAWNIQRGSQAVILRLEENQGIAAAQNVGIKWSLNRENAKFVLLMDQDSIPAPDMVAQLYTAYDGMAVKDIPIAAVGPRYRDSDSGKLSKFVRVGYLGFTLLDCATDDSVVEADFLISSGALLSLTVIKSVGLMDESLFIDHVDTEWCFRAKSMGLRLFGVCGAVMNHTLGERRKDIWFMRRRSVPFHSPFRYYYIYRNSTSLYSRTYMPWSWKMADMARCVKMAVFFGLFATNRLACLKMMAVGLADGYKGVSGKRDKF